MLPTPSRSIPGCSCTPNCPRRGPFLPSPTSRQPPGHSHGTYPHTHYHFAPSPRLSRARSQENDRVPVDPQPATSNTGSQNVTPAAARLPDFSAGVNWYCYTVLGLLFLVDFTPLGTLIASQSSSTTWLCLLQWGACLLPTVAYAAQRGWDLPDTFQLRPASPQLVAAGAAAGAVLWAVVAAAISWKAGVPLFSGADVPTGQPSPLLQLVGQPSSVADWASLVATTALSPAVVEELLFRGFLLTAIQQRLGRVDAFMVAAALFAAIHLSVEQFFPFCVLGIACGAAATYTRSVLPAIALHAGHNAAALAAGALLLRG